MTPRMQAAERGLNKYDGKPCKACGATVKWTVNATCVPCSTEKAKEGNKRHREAIKGLMQLARLKGSGK